MRNLMIIFGLTLFVSCYENSNKTPKIRKINEAITFWEINGGANPGKNIMLIDSTYIINFIQSENSDEFFNLENSKYSFFIESFIRHKSASEFITDLNFDININMTVIDSSNVLLEYEIGDDQDILKLNKINYGLTETKELLKTWEDYLYDYNKDTIVYCSGQEFGLEMKFRFKGKIIYNSVALIVDTSKNIGDVYLGPDLIIQDLNSYELYQIPNFFKNDHHFFPLSYQKTHIKRDIPRSNKYLEKIKKNLKSN